MKRTRIAFLAAFLAACPAMTACTKGDVNLSGSDGSSSGSHNGSSNSSSGSGANSGVWSVSAPVTMDGCGERIADVRQTFTVTEDGSSLVVDTDLVTIDGTRDSSGFSAGFEEGGGDCVRDYQVVFSDIAGSTANVHLVAKSNCGGQACQNEWTGTGTRVN